MKNYVKISSQINISVTSGLQHKDFTNHDSDIPNRLKVSPLWPKTTINIKQGVHWYPSELVDWFTVKSLVNNKVLTIGEFADEVDEEDALIMKQKLKPILGEKENKTKITKGKKEDITLNHLTEVE